MRIALDFDGVLADTHTAAVRLYNKYNDENVSVFDFTDWDFGDSGVTLGDYLMFSRMAWELDGCGDSRVNPIPTEDRIQFEEMVHNLNENSNVTIDVVTARTTENYEDVKNWLRYWFGDHWYESLTFEKQKHLLDYDIYIDDNPQLRFDVPVQYMPKRPWNKNVEIEYLDNVYRMDTLEDIVTHIEENRL